MTLSPFYRRALYFTLASLIAAVIVSYWPDSKSAAVAVSNTPVRAEARLEQLRSTAAMVPDKERILKEVQADLAAREKGLIVADTAAQAQAQLLQMVREIGRHEAPPVEIKNTEGFGLRPLGDAYGEVVVSVQIECRMDQLVNMLAAIAARPELVSTSDLRINASNPKEKTVNVHLSVAGVVPRKLIPEKHS